MDIKYKHWNGEIYGKYIYLDDKKTELTDDVKSDLVDIILGVGIREARNTFNITLTTEQVEELKEMKTVLMNTPLDKLISYEYQYKMQIKCAHYIKRNFGR